MINVKYIIITSSFPYGDSLAQTMFIYIAELKLPSPWSPWFRTANSTSSNYVEERFRFECQANVPDVKMIKISHAKTHVRFCNKKFKDCVRPGEIKNNAIDTYSPLDKVVRKYCKHRRRFFKKYCRCRRMGIFLICTKCNHRIR